MNRPTPMVLALSTLCMIAVGCGDSSDDATGSEKTRTDADANSDAATDSQADSDADPDGASGSGSGSGGTTQTIPLDPAAVEVSVSNTVKQELRFGIDAERLWYWRTGTFGEELAELGVKELKSEFVRVAINCAYELEEGVVDASAYDKILDMMTAMRKANPKILFFASPRPLSSAYSDGEVTSIWGGNVPWAPVPRWIMTWEENGTNADGTTKWSFGTVHQDKLAEYYAEYLNFMHAKGFDIAYLDVTNEKNNITAAHTKYLYDTIPGLLDSGVSMPELIAPSAWNYEQGVQYLDSFTDDQRSSYSIASCHNTDKTGTPESFVEAALGYGKEPWETELHGWKGIEIVDEVLSSHYFFEHVNAGFVGLDTWLFYGPLNGKDHTMLWSNNSTYAKSSKYEIFKKVVNNANGGNHLVTSFAQADGSAATDNLLSTGFIKDETLMVWVLNSSDQSVEDLRVNFGDWDVQDQDVEITVYSEGYDRAGNVTTASPIQNTVDQALEGEALYCFKVEL